MREDLFKKYHLKIAKEGFLKALFCGFLIGFLALTVCSGFFWFIGFKHYWIAFLAFALICAVTTWLFYQFKFHPTVKKIARRVDELGLEERIITMHELENDNSYIAQRQRADALSALNTVNANMIKIIVSMPMIIAVSISAFTGIGMSVVSGLAAHGLLNSGLGMLEQVEEEGNKEYFEIFYEVQEGEGVIEGETYQKVAKGESTSGVLAIPDDEWVFISWSDGLEDPYREDIVEGEITYYAIFQPVEENGSMEGEGEGEGEGDMPMDAPGEGEGNGNSGEPSDNPNKNGGGKYEEVNQVIDNKTFYGDLYGSAYEEAIDQIGGGDYSSTEKDLVGGYFDGIELGESEKN